MRKKKPIVKLRRGQTYVSGRNVPDQLNNELNRIAKNTK